MAKFEHRVGEMLAAASPLAVELRGLTSTLTSLRWWNENRYPAGAKAPATVAGLRTAVNRCIIAAELCTTDSAFAGLVEAPPPVPGAQGSWQNARQGFNASKPTSSLREAWSQLLAQKASQANAATPEQVVKLFKR